jgi:hypothetical protein
VAGLADGGVQADDPELAEDSLLVAAVSESIAASAHERFVGEVDLLRTDAAVTLGALEDVGAALVRLYTSFDSCHTKMISRIN